MWTETDNKLYRKFEFANFSEAFAFMTRVAIEAEKMDHHPTWTNTWNAVEIWLNTHSAGNIVTDKDRELAKKIDALIAVLLALDRQLRDPVPQAAPSYQLFILNGRTFPPMSRRL